MFRKPIIAFMFIVAGLNAGSQTTAPVTLRQNGWVIDCSEASSTLSISADRLGSIAREIQLNEETPSGLRRLTHFSAHVDAIGQLIIKTTDPNTEWEFDTRPDKVTIVTTDFQGVMTGWADSPEDRSVVRLLDPEGLPVSWRGTGEVTETYGGETSLLWTNLP